MVAVYFIARRVLDQRCNGDLHGAGLADPAHLAREKRFHDLRLYFAPTRKPKRRCQREGRERRIIPRGYQAQKSNNFERWLRGWI